MQRLKLFTLTVTALMCSGFAHGQTASVKERADDKVAPAKNVSSPNMPTD